MAKTLILHSGMHKTGSSSIQNFLQQTLPSEIGFIRNRPNSGKLLRSLVSRSDWYTSNKIDFQVEFNSLFSQKPTLHILSAEFLSAAKFNELEIILSYLLERYEKVHHFAYIRDPFELAPSMWQQRLKGLPPIKKSTDSLDTFKITESRYLSLSYLARYKHSKYTSKLRSYKHTVDANGSIVKDFSHEFGISSNTSDSPEERYKNKSLSQDAASLLYQFRKSKEFLCLINSYANSASIWDDIVNSVVSFDRGPKLIFSNKLLKLVVHQSSIIEYTNLLLFCGITKNKFDLSNIGNNESTISNFSDLLLPNKAYLDKFINFYRQNHKSNDNFIDLFQKALSNNTVIS